MSVVTYLDRIIAHHREAAANDRRASEPLLTQAKEMGPGRGFRAALAGEDHLSVISEIKRRSPSKGDLFVDLDPTSLAGEYAEAGAACLSVLTDSEFFGGSSADLAAARAACGLPVLRKDFTVCPLDVIDARLMGADCVLLIAAALEADLLVELHRLATDLGLDVLVEIHDESELEVALRAEATLIGVNQRDLVTFSVDHDRAVRMAEAIPDHVVKVAESGVRHDADARALRAAGYDAVLVGEALVTSGSPGSTLRALLV